MATPSNSKRDDPNLITEKNLLGNRMRQISSRHERGTRIRHKSKRHDRGTSRIPESHLEMSTMLFNFRSLTESLGADGEFDEMKVWAPGFVIWCQQKMEKMTQRTRRYLERHPRIRNARTTYEAVSQDCEALIFHPAFDVFILLCILLAAIATSLEVHLHLNPHEHTAHHMRTFIRASAGVTVTIFTCEILIKLVACGEHPTRYFTDADDGIFNTFDFIIVVTSLATFGRIEGEMISVFRLLRLVKLMSKLQALREILLGLMAGMRAVGSIMVLMFLVTFLFSILGHLLFSDNDPAHFDTVQSGMLSLFVFATLTSWGNAAQINFFGEDSHFSYFCVLRATCAAPSDALPVSRGI